MTHRPLVATNAEAPIYYIMYVYDYGSYVLSFIISVAVAAAKQNVLCILFRPKYWYSTSTNTRFSLARSAWT